MYRNYPVHYYLIITLGRVIILYSARCTNIIDNNNNISVYILTSLQFQTAHNHHKMMNDSFSFLTLIISVIYSDVNLFGGGERDRTDDLLLAKQALSQLSYTPKVFDISNLCAITMVGPGRLELPTSRLSGVRSNQAELRALIN